MKPHVEEALEELRQGLPGHCVRVKEDPDGGAFVIVEGVDLGEGFEPGISWIGFHITWPYPDADVYPHFIDAGVRHVGKGAAPNENPESNLPAAMTRGATMPGFAVAGIQVSRRSNRRDATTDSALRKLLRVIEFLRSR